MKPAPLMVLTICAAAVVAGQQQPGQPSIWNIQLGPDQQAPSTLTISNECQQQHHFTVTLQQLPFLQLLESGTLSVGGQNDYSLPVRVNTAGMKPGKYQGKVLIKCDTCKQEPNCKLDVKTLTVQLAVQQPAAASAGPAAPPRGAPPARGGPPPPPMAAPTRIPSSSSSPSTCTPPPAPTYAVKDLKVLPPLDSFAPQCMATGVNDAGNVSGACLGKYKGGTPSGGWRAFRTEAGGAVITAIDDLGFPAGAVGGVSFAMAVNAPGHTVGYWADAPTGGIDYKAFWTDGKKMINLHPPSFPLKLSEAYALNKLDDVVGAAWTLFTDKHAIIWPAGAHVMTDLNDYMSPAAKKDWMLMEAYAISDTGEIVGRAKHADKLHAFLLKAKGDVPIDLGALAEFKDDSSAAYSLNACEDVVGYTYTSKAIHHGFLWLPTAGMSDLGAIPPKYPASYAQAVNEKGEIAGVAAGFHHSAFFEGIGFEMGTDPFGVAYSHGTWSDGTSLKDLNAMIPGYAGWEVGLANGINGKGEIAGVGFFKPPAYSGGSLIMKAVLLVPGGLSPAASGGAKSTSTASSKTPCPLAISSGGYLFDNWNVCGVINGPTADTKFTLASSTLITFIATYHWNFGAGDVPTKGISVKDSSGKLFGPWAVTTSAGTGGAVNVNWECHPGVVLPAGTYTIVDPAPATWSQNAASGYAGFARVAGSPK